MLRKHLSWRRQYIRALALGLGMVLTPLPALAGSTLPGYRSDLVVTSSSSSTGTSATSSANSPPLDPSKLGFSYILPLSTPGTTEATGTKKTATTSNLLTTTTTTTTGTTTTKPLAVPANPAYPSISGFAYIDSNHNGKKDKGEWAIGNARIIVKPSGHENDKRYWISALTRSDGSYYFDLTATKKKPYLGPGKYSVWELVQPEGFKDGIDTRGTLVDSGGHYIGGMGTPYISPSKCDEIYNITLKPNTRGENYNFGEAAADPTYISKRQFLSMSGSSISVHPYPFSNVTVPEPGTVALLLAGGGMLAATTWFRRRKRAAR
jgi:hypothetical protein